MVKPNLVLLAGGQSTRFAPFTNKNFFPFLGKSLIYQQLFTLSKYPFGMIYLVTSEKSKELVKPLLNEFKNTKIVVQEGTGIGSAVNSALSQLSKTEPLLVMNADDLFDESIFKLFFSKFEELNKSKQCALIGYRVDDYFPGGYLKLNEQNMVVQVIEKPALNDRPSNLVKPVFDFFYQAAILKPYLTNLNTQNDDAYEQGLTKLMQEGHPFVCLTYSGYWQSLKYPWQVLNFMNFFLNKISKNQIGKRVSIAKTAIITGPVVIEDGVKILDHTTISGPAYIGKNSTIGNNALVRNSTIGENCVIGFGSEVARSYLKNHVWLHMNYVGDSVIDSNVSFGSTAVTANLRLDEANIAVLVKEKEINSQTNKLGALIGKNVRIGVGVKIMPGIKIGQNSAVAPEIVLDTDLPENTFITCKTDFLERKTNRLDISKLKRK